MQEPQRSVVRNERYWGYSNEEIAEAWVCGWNQSAVILSSEGIRSGKFWLKCMFMKHERSKNLYCRKYYDGHSRRRNWPGTVFSDDRTDPLEFEADKAFIFLACRQWKMEEIPLPDDLEASFCKLERAQKSAWQSSRRTLYMVSV